MSRNSRNRRTARTRWSKKTTKPTAKRQAEQNAEPIPGSDNRKPARRARGLSLSTLLVASMPDKRLPDLDREVVHLIPATVARDLRAVPVAGDAHHVTLVCERVPTDGQMRMLQLMCGDRDFEFVTDDCRYADVRSALDSLLDEHFPPEPECVPECDWDD